MKKIIFILLLLNSLPVFSLNVRCSDFNHQAEAQKWHNQNKQISKLDRDKDGEACECLRGGSAYNSNKCKN